MMRRYQLAKGGKKSIPGRGKSMCQGHGVGSGRSENRPQWLERGEDGVGEVGRGPNSQPLVGHRK